MVYRSAQDILIFCSVVPVKTFTAPAHGMKPEANKANDIMRVK